MPLITGDLSCRWFDFWLRQKAEGFAVFDPKVEVTKGVYIRAGV
jgi:hypothetical protein